MPAPTPQTIAPSKIAEVKAFLRAKEALDDLRALFPAAFTKLVDIARVYNATLTAADKAVRERDCSCGPFELYSYSRRFNAALLYTAVGRQKFSTVGGVIDESPKLSIDKERFEAAVADERVAPELAETVLSYTPSYHAPKPIILP